MNIPYESLKQLLGLKILSMRIQIRDLYDPGSGMENSGTGINIGSATLDTIPTSFFHSYLELWYSRYLTLRSFCIFSLASNCAANRYHSLSLQREINFPVVTSVLWCRSWSWDPRVGAEITNFGSSSFLFTTDLKKFYRKKINVAEEVFINC